MALKIYLNYFVPETPIFRWGNTLGANVDIGFHNFIDEIFPIFLKRLKDRGLLKYTKTGDSVYVFLSARSNYCSNGYAIRITCADGVFDSQNYNLWWEGATVGYYVYNNYGSIIEECPSGGWNKYCTVPTGYLGWTVPSPQYPTDSLPVNTAIKTLAYVEKKIFEYNRKVSVSVQNKVTNGDVAGWVVAVAGAIGEGFQSATSSSVGAAFVKEMKEFTNLFKFTSGLVNGTKSTCVIDIPALETSAQSNLSVTFSNIKAWFNIVGLPAVYKTALGCQTILGKLAIPMATFMAFAPKLEGDHEEYIYLTADNQISSSETDKRIVIKGKLSTSDFWDLYSQAMIEEYGDSIANGTYSTTANDVNTAAEAYAQQQQAQAQSDYYDAMSEYYQNVNASGGTANLGTVTLASGQTISLATGQKVDLNIATGTAVPLTVPETTKVGLNILDGQAIELDLTGVESMTPLPIQPVEWNNNVPPPWFLNPIELHLSSDLSTWTVPNIKIDTPVIPAVDVNVPDVNVKVDVNVPSIPNIDVNVPSIPNIKIDTPTLPNIQIDGSAITLTPPTSIPLTAPTEPVPMTFDTTSAEAIKAISDNIASRNELETTRAEADTVLRDLQITNEQTTKDNTVKTTEKLYADLAVATSEAALRGSKFGSEQLLEYVPAQVQAYNNLHDGASFKTKEGMDIKKGYYANPVLANQKTYNDTQLSEGKIRGKDKFVKELLPTLKAIIPETTEGTIKRFADVNPSMRDDFDEIVKSMFVSGVV